MSGSKVNDSPDASDYTWQMGTGYTLRAGRCTDGVDVCYIEAPGIVRSSVQTYTEADAVQLATDLLGWAAHVRGIAKGKMLSDALDGVLSEGALLKKQAE